MEVLLRQELAMRLQKCGTDWQSVPQPSFCSAGVRYHKMDCPFRSPDLRSNVCHPRGNPNGHSKLLSAGLQSLLNAQEVLLGCFKIGGLLNGQLKLSDGLFQFVLTFQRQSHAVENACVVRHERQ